MEKQELIIYKSADGKASVALYARDGDVWLSQNQMAELFSTSKPNVSMHISNILEEKELGEVSVVKDFLTTATDGKNYSVRYYALPMILALGFRVRSIRGTQFRQWANRHLHEYMVKGFVMDDERLKNPEGRPDYFNEMLARIRDIRASEKRFYQKVRDLFALCSDYDPSDKATQMFFAETQNKLLFAVSGRTAAEIVIDRADASQPNMGLTHWKGAIVRKGDVIIAKNYLSADEIDTLNRLVVIFLETAELRAKTRIDITIDFWRDNVDRILSGNDMDLLDHKGTIRHQQMETQAGSEYKTFNERRKKYDAKRADAQDLKELQCLEKTIQQEQGKA